MKISFSFPFLRVIAACKTKVKLKRLSICYDFQKFIQSFQCMRDSTINLENYSGMRSCLFIFESEISLTPANTLECNFYSRMQPWRILASVERKEKRKMNGFLSKPWSLLKSKFSKVFMMCKAVRDFGWCRKQAFIFKIKREKRNLIKDDQGSFLFIFLECKTPFLAWFHFVIFLPYEVRTFYSSNTVFILTLMKILRKSPVFCSFTSYILAICTTSKSCSIF